MAKSSRNSLSRDPDILNLNILSKKHDISDISEASRSNAKNLNSVIRSHDASTPDPNVMRNETHVQTEMTSPI